MVAVPAMTAPQAAAPSPPSLRLARTLRDRVARIERRAAGDDAGAWDDGKELAAIEEGRLWRHGGYRSMNDFLQRGLRRLAASTARQRWQVARRLPREFACAHGLLKCYFGLRLVALEAIRPTPPALERLLIDAERDGRMTLVPFARASTNEVRRAAARRRPPVDPLRRLPQAWRARLRLLARALRPHEAAGGRPALSISTRGRAPERALVRIAVPLDRLDELQRALGEVLRVRAAPSPSTRHATGQRRDGTYAPPTAPRRPRASPPKQGFLARRSGRFARPVARTAPGASPHRSARQPPAAGPGVVRGDERRPERAGLAPVRARSGSCGPPPPPAHSSTADRRRPATNRRGQRSAPS